MINVEEYMPLVSSITTKRYRQFKLKYTYEDLFQIGCVGLMKAAKKFDESRNVKFSTYAYTWIDGYLLCSIRSDKWYLAKNKEERFTAKAPLSLDTPIINFNNEENSNTYLDQLSDERSPFRNCELKILMDKLPSKLKKIIILRYFKDLTQAQASKILGISQSNVSKYEIKALKILRKELII